MSDYLKSKFRIWLRALADAFIQGGATAGQSWLACSGAHSMGFDIPELNFSHLMVICLAGGMKELLNVLKSKPLPEE